MLLIIQLESDKSIVKYPRFCMYFFAKSGLKKLFLGYFYDNFQEYYHI